MFMTGQDEIEQCCSLIREAANTEKKLSDDFSELLVLPLYAALPTDVQQKVFQ